jgi:aryl carrier-like protein
MPHERAEERLTSSQMAQLANMKRKQQVSIQLQKLVFLQPKLEIWKQLQRYPSSKAS